MAAGVLTAGVEEVQEAVAAADSVVAVGGRTHWEVGDAPPGDAIEVRAPVGVVAYDPAELTVTVAAGTTVADLAGVLAEAGQECPIDPREPDRATVGGAVAAGLSGHRRLRYGPVRDRVLEVRFVTAQGRLVKGGGATVKNVSGYDLPRLLVGSLGTIGVVVQVTLRCQPRPALAVWATGGDPSDIRRLCFRPSCIAWDGKQTHVLLEGHPDDVTAEIRSAGVQPADAGPVWPRGPHRGRVSIRARDLPALAESLTAIPGVRWLAEVGVGTVHVAADASHALASARRVATDAGGWLLREAGGDGLDGFGIPVPNAGIMRRIKDAFDPTGKLAPGRLPL